MLDVWDLICSIKIWSWFNHQHQGISIHDLWEWVSWLRSTICAHSVKPETKQPLIKTKIGPHHRPRLQSRRVTATDEANTTQLNPPLSHKNHEPWMHLPFRLLCPTWLVQANTDTSENKSLHERNHPLQRAKEAHKMSQHELKRRGTRCIMTTQNCVSGHLPAAIVGYYSTLMRVVQEEKRILLQ